MESPEPSNNNNGSSSASPLNGNHNDYEKSSKDSPFYRYVNALSPIPTKAPHAAQGFLGLNSPPLVFKSPRISHRETQPMERPQGTQSLSGDIYQSENGGNSLGVAAGDSGKSNSEQPLPERFVADTQKVFDSKNDTNAQNNSSLLSIDEYLADPGDIDQVYSDDNGVEQSTDAAESSLNGLTQLDKNISKDGPGDKNKESLGLSEDSNKVYQEKSAYGQETEKIEGEKNDVQCASQDPTKLESNLAAGDFDKQYCDDPHPQDVQGCEDYNETVSTSHVTAENISQEGSEATLKYHGIRRRCLQFGEAASNALGSNKPHVKLNATSNEMKMVKLSEPVTSLCPQRGSGNLPLTETGIGVHSNGFINAMPTGQAATTGVRLSESLQVMKSAPSIRLQRMENVKRSILSSSSGRPSLVETKNESREIVTSVSSDAENSEDFNQPPNPRKKKMRTSVIADNNGCKRCNCKKSKCLKLYCDCFAIGAYCTNPCACQGCLNRPEYAETVSETKKRILARNANAFAPKIVKANADNMEDENLTTPSSARHKRGCNCKRSKCQKKYCECYQANVGCSSGCRCEGCMNVYGKKDYVSMEKRALSKERVSNIVQTGSDSTSHNKLEMVASKTNYDAFSPITPSFQFSDQGKEAAKSRVFSSNCLPCPESNVSMIASSANYTSSSEKLHRRHALLETNEMLTTAPYDSQNNCNNVDMMDQYTPVSHPEPLSGASSVFSGANEWTNIPQSRLSHGSIRQLPSGSLRWRSSPLTPSTGVGEAHYLQCPESDNRLFDILENETPDTLMQASTPMRSVKVNSPTQKRVSPPQIRYHGFGSSSSGGLRPGRKFMLKSVPSFPPLSPCVDSKGNDKEDLGDSESKCSNSAKECPQ
ncbi:protein tesmin/TSO1-like CXC 2 [Cajanus cajan]|uniref:protein tesmin/TSO1-like CXC 2 n=1 Tax=Cajanus cajan TaxID=3821 RepID=UPI00098D9832|nr:protein tesmin/TSO1-like CXC 2 [Cajanus cajan]